MTVPEAARRVRRNPETIRRWIRSGRLRSRKIGSQHLVEETEVLALVSEPPALPVPGGWGTAPSGAPMPDGARLVRAIRDGH